MRSIYASILLLVASLCAAQQLVNPVTQVYWPAATGSGAPGLSCASANYGQPYTDVTNSAQYVCGAVGWFAAVASGTVSPGSVGQLAQYTAGSTVSGTTYVTSAHGGTGLDTSGATGCPSVSSGAWSVVACPAGTGTVTSFAAPSAGWPSWLVPSVSTATTTPSLTLSLSAIPNAALANTSTTVNGQPCVLGSTCSISSLPGVTVNRASIVADWLGTVTSANQVFGLLLPDASTTYTITNCANDRAEAVTGSTGTDAYSVYACAGAGFTSCSAIKIFTFSSGAHAKAAVFSACSAATITSTCGGGSAYCSLYVQGPASPTVVANLSVVLYATHN